uniref:Reverse transcriptase domain-containing protein n=1 Tax=Caenorhabditis tropicalis TaxID=1561998 RepID=A0A1I7UFW0_9PELO
MWLISDQFSVGIGYQFLDKPMRKMVLVKESKELSFVKGPGCFELYCVDIRTAFKPLLDYITNFFGVQPHISSIQPPHLWILEIIKYPLRCAMISSNTGSDGK